MAADLIHAVLLALFWGCVIAIVLRVVGVGPDEMGSLLP